MLNLILWGYSFALEESYFATLIFVFVAAIFMGIRELSVALADPYGDDAADFPLNEWMNQLYVRVRYFCEEDWTPGEAMQTTTVCEAMPVVDKNASVIDLLTDLHRKEVGQALKKAKALDSAMDGKEKKSKVAPAVSKPAPDGGGSY